MMKVLSTLACCMAIFIVFGCAEGGRLTESRIEKTTKERAVSDNEHSLTPGERKTLLQIARDTIESHVKSGKIPGLDNYPITDRLREKRGAFVTITNPAPSSPVHPASLRGCIGNFTASGPLCETVREMAVSACSRDTRFPPVGADELEDIKIEISVLSPLMPAEDPLSIRKGVHGIYIRDRRGFGGGTYLPQVWSDHFADRDAGYFWSHLCRFKAGLPAEAWLHPERYDVLVYTADVFGEDDK